MGEKRGREKQRERDGMGRVITCIAKGKGEEGTEGEREGKEWLRKGCIYGERGRREGRRWGGKDTDRKRTVARGEGRAGKEGRGRKGRVEKEYENWRIREGRGRENEGKQGRM